MCQRNIYQKMDGALPMSIVCALEDINLPEGLNVKIMQNIYIFNSG
jgi:hypothetical protein